MNLVREYLREKLRDLSFYFEETGEIMKSARLLTFWLTCDLLSSYLLLLSGVDALGVTVYGAVIYPLISVLIWVLVRDFQEFRQYQIDTICGGCEFSAHCDNSHTETAFLCLEQDEFKPKVNKKMTQQTEHEKQVIKIGLNTVSFALVILGLGFLFPESVFARDQVIRQTFVIVLTLYFLSTLLYEFVRHDIEKLREDMNLTTQIMIKLTFIYGSINILMGQDDETDDLLIEVWEIMAILTDSSMSPMILRKLSDRLDLIEADLIKAAERKRHPESE